MIVVEATGIRDVPSGPLLRIGHDRFVAGPAASSSRAVQRGVERRDAAVHPADRLPVDPAPARRATSSSRGSSRSRERASRGAAPRRRCSALDATTSSARGSRRCADGELADDAVAARARGPRARLSRARHRHAPAAHRASCRAVLPRPVRRRGRRARSRPGFDGVELHFAHAYTMASFLSALNTRDDGYGGSREHRVRLPLEVIAAVRAARRRRAASSAAATSATTSIEGGNRTSTTRRGSASSSRAPASTSCRSRRAASSRTRSSRRSAGPSYPYTGQSGYECMPTIYSDARGPFARNVPLAATIRAAVRDAGFDDAGRHRRRHLRVRAGRGDPRARRGRLRRVGAADARRSRLVREDPRGPRRRDPALRVHELLRGARPAAQAGDLQAVGSRRARRSPTSRSPPTASAGSSRRAGASSYCRPRWTSSAFALGSRPRKSR